MRGEVADAYEVLGLEPGADRATIDQAYRSLIKRYHPDRDGGNAERAAEINQAYFQLRDRPAQAPDCGQTTNIAEALHARGARRQRLRRGKKRRILPWVAILLALAAPSFIYRARILTWFEDRFAQLRPQTEPSSLGNSFAPQGNQSLDSPIDQAALQEAVRQAKKLHFAGSDSQLAESSRECHEKLRARPSLQQLDRCAAFDTAVLDLQRRDPMRDDGPFNATVVTARQIAGARLLTDDFVAIEGRLDRVRGAVQLELGSAELPPGPLDVP